MKRKFTFLIAAAVMLLTMMATTGTMWGQTSSEANWIVSEQGYSNQQAVTNITFDNSDISGVFSGGTNTQNVPGYYTTGAGVRMYKFNTLEISSSNATISIIEFTYSQNNKNLNVNTGTYTKSTAKWEGSASSVTFTVEDGSGHNRIQAIKVTYSTGGSSLTDSDLTLTGAPVALNFDLYNNSTAQTVSYTTSSTGAVTVSGGEGYVTTSLSGNTITVTPTAVTPSAQTITVSQAADDNYKAGSQTFTVSITDSTPFAGGDVTFTAGTDLGSTTANNSPDEMTKSGVTIYSTDAAFATTQYRIYSGSTTTISVNNNNVITSIVFTKNGSYDLSKLSTTTGSYNSSTGTWTGNAASIDFSASAQVRLDKIVVTVAAPTSNPYITAVNVDIDYDVTGGNITYTINNEPNPAGSLTAAIKDGTTPTIANFSLGPITGEAVPFTCGANTESTAHTAEVTLTYTYNTNETVTKDVTITQAADPNATMTIAEVREQATGSVATKGIVTSCVGTTGYIQDATAAICVYGSELTVGDEIRVEGSLTTYKGLLEITNPTVTVISNGNTVTPTVKTIAEINEDVYTASTSIQGLYVKIEEATVNAISGQNVTIAQSDNTIVVRFANTSDITFVANNIITLDGNIGCFNDAQIANPQNIEVQQPTEATIFVSPATVNAPFAGADGSLTITYENIPDLIAFDIQFCDANGNELQGDNPDWIDAEINEPTSPTDNYTVYFVIGANDGEARNAYFKVYTFVGANLDPVYSNLITVNQAEYVAPTYAELPFEFDGGKADIESTDGLTQEGLGSDYNNSPKLKFDGTGDWLLLQFQERPGTLTFDIKNNSFSGGTFTVQTSEDGATYTDLQAYTEITGTQNEEFTNLGENVRYIKWIYTEKVNGNVGLGNIALTKYVAPVASITVDTDVVNATADETEGTLTVTYENIDFTIKPEVVWYESNGTTETTDPEWMLAEINNDNNVYYMISDNDGNARTAYFKVCGADAQTNLVYSELVTVTQAAAPQNYSLTVEPFENLELITFINDEMAMEADGTIQVTSGAQVMLSIVANEGYVIETLMVNGVDHANDIDAGDSYSFAMPGENVTISATAVEYIPPVVGNYVRINDISYLTDGAKVIIAARYDDDNTDGYYAMQNATTNKPTGVLFTSTTENSLEVLPSNITDEENVYYWIVGVTENGYTFTNANDDLIGYNSGTNFATGGNNTEWNIEFGTSEPTAMVANYDAFTITNHNQNNRGFALNSNYNFGPYAISNNTSGDYNFYLDFFVQGAEPVVTPSISLSSYEINAPASETIEILTITPAYIENFDVDKLSADYCNADGSEIEGSKPTFVEFAFSENEGYKLTCTIADNNGEARTAYFKVKYDNGGTDVVSNVVTVNQAEYVAPVATITVDPTSVSATAAETEDYLAITLDNIVITEEGNGEFDLIFCDNEGEPLPDQSNKPEWFAFEFSFNDVWSMPYTISANTETTARTLYCKVKGTGDDGTTVAYSELVTVTQAAFVIDYATLPFEWAGGPRSEFEALNGASTYSVGDYGENHGVYRMKLDGTGDYIQVKTNEQPGVVTVGVKMVGGDATSTLTVQGSADGETFTNVEALTISGSQYDELTLETTNNFAATDRYVRLLFTKGSNVGVGPITIAKVDNTPSIKLNSYTIEAPADGAISNLTATYNNINEVLADVEYYESNGTTVTTYDWFEAEVNSTDNTIINYVIEDNDGNARTAYFKVYALVGSEYVYSDLVTVSQAAYIPPVPTTTYTLASSIESGLHYIITNGTDKAMGMQTNNNRAAVAITIENDATTIAEDAGVYEVVINGPDANGNYTIYDKQYPGYLYAASSGSNYLKTREGNSDANSQWSIEFEAAGNAIITAQGNYTRNLMRYNGSSDIFSCYASGQQSIYLYVKENDADYEYYGTAITYTENTIPTGETITVGAGSVMTVVDPTFTNTNPASLVIEEGGQLIHDNPVNATVQKGISAYSYSTKSGDGWYLIASPVDNYSTSTIATGTYDLFQYSEPDATWYVDHDIPGYPAAHPFNTLTRGQGYLYANAANIDLDFAGEMIGTGTEVTKTLSYEYDGGGDLKGFNLMGNPFSRNLTANDMKIGEDELGNDINVTLYYDFDATGTELEVKVTNDEPIKPGHGFFIQANENNPELVFNPSSTKDANEIGLISIKAGDESYIDKAYIQFGGGNTLRKMTFSGDKSQVYVINNREDFAAARFDDAKGSIPVHFKAAADGNYTINIETTNLDFEYFRLLDTFTGEEIDLLAESGYKFQASSEDPAERFILLFQIGNINGVDENAASVVFVYQSGDELFFNGDGTLQVFDVMGRFVMSREIHGNERISTSMFNTGVYVFRLVGETVMTQKIVVR